MNYIVSLSSYSFSQSLYHSLIRRLSILTIPSIYKIIFMVFRKKHKYNIGCLIFFNYFC